MKTQQYYLAQLSIAHTKAPLDDPLMAGFLSQIEQVYSVADHAPGFVWQLQVEDGSLTMYSTGDPRIIVTMTVWKSIAALHDFVYRSDHLDPLRERTQWFEKLDEPSLVLWWIPHDSRPRVEQGMARLKYLRRHGPTSKAFTFRNWFPPPRESISFEYTG